VLDAPSRFAIASVSAMLPPPTADMDIPRLRALTNRPLVPLWLPRLGLDVSALRIPGPGSDLPARLYRPPLDEGGLVLFFHGGGFVQCGLDSHDGICCRLARSARAAVLSVDYRMAPEHKFPAAPEDAYASLLWAVENADALGIDPRRIAVAGDSAGGNLSAAVSLMARDRGGPLPAFQLLYYPATHGGRPVPSHDAYAEGFLLSREQIDWFTLQYAGKSPPVDDPRFAPFAAASHAGLPPARIITAECDPLRDEGTEYAAKLCADGGEATLSCYPSTIHGFLNFYPFMPKGRQAIAEGGGAIRDAFARVEGGAGR